MGNRRLTAYLPSIALSLIKHVESYAWYIYNWDLGGMNMYIYALDYHSEGVYWAEDKALIKTQKQNEEVVISLAPADARSSRICLSVRMRALNML